MATNSITLCGKLEKDVKFSHSCMNKDFYEGHLIVDRYSGNADILPILLESPLTQNGDELVAGTTLSIVGKIRTTNKIVGDRSKMVLSVLCKEVSVIEDSDVYTCTNEAEILGYICKPIVSRETPKGKIIADVLVAVNRLQNKTDYIYCIAWGSVATKLEGLEIGTRLHISGRLQSREYVKVLPEGNEIRVAYELSISSALVMEA